MEEIHKILENKDINKIMQGQIKYNNHISVSFFPGGINQYIDSDGTWGNYQGPFGLVPDDIYEEALRFVGRTDLLIRNEDCPNYDFLYQIYFNNKRSLNVINKPYISQGTIGSFYGSGYNDDSGDFRRGR